MPPLPKRKPLILDGVKDENVRSEIEKHEGGAYEHLYKDTGKNGGYVTIGVGHKIDSVEEAKRLPFEIKDKNGKYKKASAEEIERAFKKVEAIENENHAADEFKPRLRTYKQDSLMM